MIRGLLALLFVIVFLIGSIPLFLVEWLLGKVRPDWRDMSSLRIVQWAFRCVSFFSGTRLVVRGLEKVPRDQGVVFIANHRSIFDIVLCYPLCPGRTGFIAKDSIKKVPLLSVWMRFLYCQFLNRDDIREGVKMVQNAAEHVREGVSIFICPEGHRSREADMLEFKGGSFKIATKAGAPIIPVAITNSSAVLEDHMPLIRAATVVVTFGDAIDPKPLSMAEKRKLPETVQERIRGMLAENAAVWEEKAHPREKEAPRSLSNPGFVPESPLPCGLPDSAL